MVITPSDPGQDTAPAPDPNAGADDSSTYSCDPDDSDYSTDATSTAPTHVEPRHYTMDDLVNSVGSLTDPQSNAPSTDADSPNYSTGSSQNSTHHTMDEIGGGL